MIFPLSRFFRTDKAVLLVCTANICRSPMAEGLLRQQLKQRGLARRVRVDSAGIQARQQGSRADPRAHKACLRRGVSLQASRARQVRARDFKKFDYILAMDQTHLEWLVTHAPQPCRARIALLGDWLPDMPGADIADPYFGSQDAFTRLCTELETALSGFVNELADALDRPDTD